jgi:hypothetical protein
MKRFDLILLAFAILPAAAIAQGLPDAPHPARSDAADWNRIGRMAHDQEIVVSARGRRLHCFFIGATNDSLFCERSTYWRDHPEDTIPRMDVEQVRLDQIRRNWKIAIWGFAAAGAAWGAADSHTVTKGAPRAVGGIVGGLGGACFGMIAGVPISLLIPGRLVYRRAKVDQSALAH